MTGEYITLEEAAKLEEIKYNTMVQRVNRNTDKYELLKERRTGGGRDMVKVAVASLSRKAQLAYKERKKLLELAAGGADQAQPAGKEPEKPPEPWYVTTDPAWYMEAHKKEWYQAVECGNVVRDWLAYEDKGRSDRAEEFAQQRLGKGKRTLYRYVKAYLEAQAWADKLEKEDGCSYDHILVLALCRKPKESGTFPSFTPEIRKAIRGIWLDKEFAQNLGTKEMLYDKLKEIAKLNGWEKIPSYSSVVRYITYLMEDENVRNARYLAEKGERAYKNKVMAKAERDTHDLLVMDVVMGDVHTFDCWVAYPMPNGKVKAIRPKLVAWVDIRSRMILGDVMCQDSNSDVLKESLLKLLYQDAGSVPHYIYIDNGKDYTAKTMTGIDRNDRQRTGFDDAAKGFYQSVGIEDFHRSLPYYAWTKAQIERFFRTVCNKFSKWFASYTGTLTGSKTEAKVKKDIDGMLERGELLTLEEFYEKWSYWLHDVYAMSPHSGLKKQGETYTKPAECFEYEERYKKALPPKRFATILMLKSERRLVRNVGIRMGNITYMSDGLIPYINRHVDIKYDPHDMATIYVFYKGKQVCEAYAQELLEFASPNGVEQKALKEHLARQKRQLKRDKEILKEAEEGLEELNEQYAGFGDAVGGVSLMEGKRPAKGGKVVSMPQDGTYRSGFRMKKNEDENSVSSYLQKLGKEALKAMNQN